MHIRRVVLEDIRGFRTLDFKFERPNGKLAGWTVITGDNASGKTALLKAIALALVGPDAARVLQPSLRGWIREGATQGIIAVEIVAGERDRFIQGRRYEQPFWSELHVIETNGPEPSLTLGDKYKKKGKGPTHGPWAENPSGWFAVGYGPFRRLYGASPDAQRIMVGPGRIARFATMFREDATLGECELWLKDLHHKKLEDRPRETAILEQVLGLLDDDFLRHGLRVERVDSQGLWLRDTSGIVLPLSSMSEGYRASLAMLIDIVRHLTEVHGHEDLIQKVEAHLQIPHSGVVLIDEVDSHLHPEWQREIGFWLKQHLPNMQFLVTTHSALICQAADERGLFHLPPPSDPTPPFQLDKQDYEEVIRSTPTQILLTPAFGMKHTRSPRAVAARQEHARLRAKEQVGLTSAEKERFVQLSLFADENGEQD
ncbi:MAG: AAA family ATPase [Gemmataceae bacterium]|nr:AAA family ATPase [Gemmataceae bacterium]